MSIPYPFPFPSPNHPESGGVLNAPPAGSGAEPQSVEFGAFLPYNLTSSGNNFNDSPCLTWPNGHHVPAVER